MVMLFRFVGFTVSRDDSEHKCTLILAFLLDYGLQLP